MNKFINGTYNELFKIFSRKKNRVLLFISIMISIILSLINVFSDLNFGFKILNAESLSVSVLNLLFVFLIPIMIFLVTGDLFSGEYGDNTIFISLTRPLSRFKVFFIKVSASFVFILTFIIATFIVSTLLSFINTDINDILRILIDNIIVYMAALIPIMLLVSLTALVSQVSKNTGETMFLMILLFLGLPVISILLPSINSVFPTGYLNFYKNFSYYSTEFSVIVNELIYIMGYAIIFLSLGLYLFEKRDI